MEVILKKITDKFNYLKATYPLKDIPQKVIDEFNDKLYVWLTNAVKDSAWNLYPLQKTLEDIGWLAAKKELSDEETKLLAEMKTNSTNLEKQIEQSEDFIKFYLIMIENFKSLNQ